MKEITLKGTVQYNHQIPEVVFDRKPLKEWLKDFKAGDEIIINISSKRSLNQNALFHKCIGIIADYMGEDTDAVKFWIKCKFFGCREEEIEGVTYQIPVETSKLSKKEMADGMTKMYKFAAENGIVLPSNDMI